MSKLAWVYILSVLLVGTIFSLWALQASPWTAIEFPVFLSFVLFATLAQLYTTRFGGHHSYHITLVFFMAAALLLNPSYFVLVVAIPHLIEWGKERWNHTNRLQKWYLQPFNIASHILVGFAARGVFLFIGGDETRLASTVSLVAAITAALTYTLLNHLLIGLAIATARRVSLHKSGLLSFKSLATDWILLLMGITVAIAWSSNFWLVLLVLAPIALMYQALSVPQLSKEAKIDAKTGLANAHHLTELFTHELARAKRFERPLAVVMADLDLLRNINNTYGHLAGDAVLAGIGDIMRRMSRDYDICGRFGGEEFMLVLPETELNQARETAERIREAIEATQFTVSTSAKPFHVTTSFGIACFPTDAREMNELIHGADIAVYQAKLQGRNRVVCLQDLPHSVRLETLGDGTATTPHTIPDPTIVRPMAVQPSIAPSQPAPSTTPETRVPSKALQPPAVLKQRNNYDVLLPVLVTLVVAAGLIFAFGGVLYASPQNDLTLILLLGLALLAQVPQIKNLYGDSSISVSMAINFAAGILAGIPGLVIVSTLIVLVHYVQRRPRLYRTLYNWATHILAGIPALLVTQFVPDPFHFPNLLVFGALASVAVMAYYFIETGLIAAGISFSEQKKILPNWRDRYGWLAPNYFALGLMGLFLAIAYREFDLIGILVAIVPVMMMSITQKQYIDKVSASVSAVKRINQELETANTEIRFANQTIMTVNEELFKTLAKIVDARDPFVSGHSLQVTVYAITIGQKLGLSAERLEKVRQAGLLHDIGKIGISEQVLHKPARLSKEEYEYIKSHSIIGADFLETALGLRQLAPIIRHHHERWDGKGYPDGLKGEHIPLEARILSVCDAVESMASDRPYQRARSVDEIVAEIERCAGTQFDPTVAQLFIDLLKQSGEQMLVNSARGTLSKNRPPTMPQTSDYQETSHLKAIGFGWEVSDNLRAGHASI